MRVNEITIPSKKKLLARLENPTELSPELAGVELALSKAEEETNRARKELQELSASVERLPNEIIAGRSPDSALEEMITRERTQALLLKSREGVLEGARQDLADAQAKARALVVEEGRRVCEELKKVVAPVLPLLEVVKDLEYEVERLVKVANMDPSRGFEFPREQLPAIEWPTCVIHEQAARSWMERTEIAPAADHG